MNISAASKDVENAATNLKKAKGWQEAARKKKVNTDSVSASSILVYMLFQVILGIIAIVVVLILLLGDLTFHSFDNIWLSLLT